MSEYNYRSAVRKLIPQLEVLDDAPAEEEDPPHSNTMKEDWALLKECIKDTTSITDSANDYLGLMGNLVSQSMNCSSSCLFIGLISASYILLNQGDKGQCYGVLSL